MVVFYYLIYSVLINLYFTFDLLPLVLFYFFLLWFFPLNDIFEETKELLSSVFNIAGSLRDI